MSSRVNGIAGLRIVAFFPVDFPHVTERSGWPSEQLDGLRGDGWRDPRPTEDLALQEYGHEVLDNLIASMPTAVLELVVGPELTESADPADRAALRSPAPGWSLVEGRISLWNLGNGLATLTYDVSAGPDATGLVAYTRPHVYAAVPAVQRLLAALTSWRDSGPVVLWGNPTYVARVEPDCPPETRRAIGTALTAEGLDCPLEELPDAKVRIGRHCSVVADSYSDPGVDLLVRLAGVHQVCWGAALIYDARLSGELDVIRPDDPGLSIADLERQAERILSTYHLVRLFRLRYDSVEAHLDSGAARVWQRLEESWKFPRVLSSLDDRLDFVRTYHQQIFARLQDGRSRLLNELVLAFTFLNLFSILLSAMTFAALGALSVRVVAGVAMVFALVLNVVVYLFFRRRLAGR